MSYQYMSTPTSRATPHRLATVSVSAVLQKATSFSNCISTGAKQVDSLLAGGLPCGRVTEVHGPPGVGKSTLGICAAANALYGGSRVVWLDCGYQVSCSRLENALDTIARDTLTPAAVTAISQDKPLERFTRYSTPSLAQFLALVLYPPSSFPPRETRLLVIDSLSTLFILAFPSNWDISSSNRGKETPQQWAASRRWTLQRDVISALNKLAAIHDLAVLVTCQMATKIDREMMGPTRGKAILRPTMNTKSWTDGVWARLILFRHWGQHRVSSAGSGRKANQAEAPRYAGLVKLGNIQYETFGRCVPFMIAEDGIKDVGTRTVRLARSLSPRKTVLGTTVPSKRRATEVADSESEDGEAELVAAVEEPEIEELDEMGLTREEQALLELELENSNMHKQ